MKDNFRVFEIDDEDPDFSLLDDDSLSSFSEELEETLSEEGWISHPSAEKVIREEIQEEELLTVEPVISDLYGLRSEQPERNVTEEFSQETIFIDEEIHNTSDPVVVPVFDHDEPEEIDESEETEAPEDFEEPEEIREEGPVIHGVADDEFYRYFGDLKLSVESVPQEDLEDLFFSYNNEEWQEKSKQDELYEIPQKNSVAKNILSWVLTVLVAFVIAVVVNVFVFRPSEVSGSSMQPTLQNGDTVILSRLPYLFESPDRGDIVVIDSRIPVEDDEKRTVMTLFSEAMEHNIITKMFGVKEPDYFWIKRVIGIAGDTISFEANCVYRNGEKMHESYINEQDTYTYPNGVSADVPEGYVFVMGDNRNHSSDSRVIGLVPVENIIGKMIGKW